MMSMEEQIDKFQTKTAKEIAWRKKEITSLLFLLDTFTKKEQKEELNILYRSAYTLLYAHWEGAIKNISNIYISVLNKIKIPLSSMEECYVTLHYIKKFYNLQKTKNKNKNEYNEIVHNIRNIENEEFFKLPEKDDEIITVQGNLNFELFQQICQMFGLEEELLGSVNQQKIDTVLLKKRNSIVHGEQNITCGSNDLATYYEEFDRLKDFIFRIIDSYIECLESKLESMKNRK